jgi:N-acetylglutamate synthase-like GNAT family acetyltransferase
MNTSKHRVRRATVDDLPSLKALWSATRLQAEDLEKRLTEFQVVQAEDGIVGALGVQILGQNGWLHSEAYQDYTVADEVRVLLMERIRALASNHGVFRLWTREKAPFWAHHGFRPQTPETSKRLPEPWSEMGSDWLTLQLKDEQALVSIEKELALYIDSERQRSHRALHHAKLIKTIDTVIALIFAVFVLGAILYLARRNPGTFIPGKK